MSIQKRGDTYAVYVYDPSQKRKRYVGTRDTERAAKRLEAEHVLERRAGGGTVEAYAAVWLRHHPRQRTSTMLHYQERIGVLVKAFGKRQLGTIDRVEAREWALANRSAHGPARAMYADAIRDGLIYENPFGNMRLQQSRGRRDLDRLADEQVESLIDHARGRFGVSFAAFVAMAAYVGMRPGELYALRWDALDLAHDEIAVRVAYSSKSGETTPPKNGQHRLIVLFPEAKRRLEQVPREDPMFQTLTGRPLTGRTLHYYWDPVRSAAGLPGLDLYELRHYCAARLLNDLGHEAEDVAYQLGHTDGGMLVRRLYGHPSEELARERLKRGFGRKQRPLRVVSGDEREQKSA